MRLYLLRQRREIWTERIFQNQFNNFCCHCVTAKSNLRILQRRFILCQKLTLSINKIGETFVKYQTVSCSCLHNNKENRFHSLFSSCSQGTWPPKFKASLGSQMSHALVMLLHQGLGVSPPQWWSDPGSSLAPTELWAPVAWTGHSGLGCPMFGHQDPGLIWDSSLGQEHHGALSQSLTQKWVFPSTKVMSVDEELIHGNLDKKRTQ